MTEYDLKTVFSKNLNAYLKLAGKTQADLARYLNVSTATVNYWCRGAKSPRMDKADRMCSFFGIRRSDLIEERNLLPSDSPPSPPTGRNCWRSTIC